jgi:EAL domain-containing protein (putative c-di-GMP-specific phosphodiesterase class I)
MHMQPVIDVHTGAIEAAEALIRWNHPTDGLRPPGVWLDIAERSGIMPELGAWALDRSITEAGKWINAVGIERAPVVHVNVSARQLDQPGFDTMVLATLDRHRFPPTKLILELTETFLAHVSAELVDELRHLHESGVRIAADDFGTGYSPLTRIIELPISMIKIDRQFLWNAVDDPRSQAIVSSLLQLASTLDFDVVAEGVETSEQRDLLRDLDCRLAQGFLWSRPVTPEAFLATLIEHHGTRVSRLGTSCHQFGDVTKRPAPTLAARTA